DDRSDVGFRQLVHPALGRSVAFSGRVEAPPLDAPSLPRAFLGQQELVAAEPFLRDDPAIHDGDFTVDLLAAPLQQAAQIHLQPVQILPRQLPKIISRRKYRIRLPNLKRESGTFRRLRGTSEQHRCCESDRCQYCAERNAPHGILQGLITRTPTTELESKP